ncbi:hypothetical protein SLEP1_g45645 [Rubroshorea leprosula]|uniref:Uncharacterized protein n=1 Tax=Rubroshorea leprosula TaxID=152421 RepID=A0AAV5LL94_9ROSI|nr:hypothetical protein SLEP1_g45645 [Rubroshorea leprosula]
MQSSSSTTLALYGKSSAEAEIAQLLKQNEAIKLPDNTQVSILLQSEVTKKPLEEEEEAFDAQLFMKSLSTNQFGRFLIWSPRLPSTHDIVSHNFSELPLGTVCVADVQFKGRGIDFCCTVFSCMLRSVQECMEISKRMPYVFFYDANGGWKNCASGSICGVSGYHGGNKRCL